jgi:dTDP-4-amino-4,6-dideoxygalactose transaminase
MIPVFEMKRQYEALKNELFPEISSVLQGGVYVMGPKVAEFESVFAQYIGVKYAVGVASGTDAITLALLSLGVQKDDEVIMPANSYPSVFGVAASGAKQVLVDIDPRTHTIDPQKIEKAITKKTKAIIPVHLYGQGADMEKIMEIGKLHALPIVEDCAQAVGAEVSCQLSVVSNQLKKEPITENRTPTTFYKKVGSFGAVGCFSFYPTKNLGAFGDGGMVVTNNEEIYKRIKLFRMYGECERYNSVLVGKNSRLDELQAAILLVKLKHLDTWIERRRDIAKLYELGIRNSELGIPFESSYAKHTYHLFVIRSNKRDRLKMYLEKQGIGTGIHYPTPIHLQKSMAYLGYKKGDFPVTEQACDEVLSLPIYPELTDAEVEYIVKKVCDSLS